MPNLQETRYNGRRITLAATVEYLLPILSEMRQEGDPSAEDVAFAISVLDEVARKARDE